MKNMLVHECDLWAYYHYKKNKNIQGQNLALENLETYFLT